MDSADRPTTSAAPDGPASGGGPDSTPGDASTDEPADPPDPAVDDVPDDTFPGLGDPRIDVEHQDVAISTEGDRPELTGTATLTLSARTAEPLGSFTLDLRGPRVTELTVDGTPAEVDAGDDELTITPAAPLDPGEPVEVVVRYEGRPEAETFPGIGVDVGWLADDVGGWFTLGEPHGTSSWVPVNGHPSDKATWRVSIDTPADLTAVSNGHLASRATTGDRRRWVWEQDRPMASYLAVVAVGRYELDERSGPAGTRVVFAFPEDRSDRYRDAFDELDDILAFYADTFGPYPDDDTGALVVPTSLGLALETQTRPTFGLDAVDGGEAWALAHEVAHEWFGNDVTPERWSDLWLSESFATYADWLWIAHRDGVDIRNLADDDESPLLRSDLAVWSTEASQTFDPAVYGKGARALHALRLTIGDDAFFALLRRWSTEQGGGNASTDDFVALAEEVSDRDLTEFVDAWFRSPDQPPLPT